MDAATAGDHRSRRRQHLRLQLPLPLSLIPVCSSWLQWICNDRAHFWIMDRGRQLVKTAERSGGASNAGCGVGYNATRWVCLWRSAGRWCVTTACIWRGGWRNYWPSLCSGRGDICNARIVQWRWGGGVLTLDCRGYETPCLRGIPLASRYRNASLCSGKLRIPWRPMLLLILTISKTSNISYNRRRDRVRVVGRDHLVWMFDIMTIGMISSECICNGWRWRLLFQRPWRDSTNKGGAVLTTLDSKPQQYLGMRSPQQHLIMGLTAIRLNSDYTQHWYLLLQQRLKVYLHRLNSGYAFMAQFSSYGTHSWHNTSNHRLCISSASRGKSPFARAKAIAVRTMTYSLSYDISCVCFFHC